MGGLFRETLPNFMPTSANILYTLFHHSSIQVVERGEISREKQTLEQSENVITEKTEQNTRNSTYGTVM
jgi:hypothetical protein